MTKKDHTQYTIRNIPVRVDKCLREAAAQYKTSLNVAAIEALRRGLGMEDKPVIHHDLDDLAGTWVGDGEFDRTMALMDRVDPELWK